MKIIFDFIKKNGSLICLVLAFLIGLCILCDIFLNKQSVLQQDADINNPSASQKNFQDVVVKYVRGKEVWNEEALDEGWENAWTPPENYKAPKKSKELGHVYFVESQGYWKIGRATAARIKIRIKEQQPDKVLAVSPITSKFKTLERKLHKMIKDKRVLKYEYTIK